MVWDTSQYLQGWKDSKSDYNHSLKIFCFLVHAIFLIYYSFVSEHILYNIIMYGIDIPVYKHTFLIKVKGQGQSDGLRTHGYLVNI